MLSHEEGTLPQYHRLANQLRTQILSGSVSGKLQPERELSASFGVSYMTTRKALGLLVNEGLLQRIQGHGTFVRNPQNTNTLQSIGLLLPAGASEGAANPYYAQILDGACQQAAADGLGLAVSDRLQTLFKPEHSRKLRMADGLIICPHAASADDLESVSRFLPVVLLEWDDGRHSCFTIDNTAGMQAAVGHLISLGHQRIAYLGGPDRPELQNAPSRERLDGYMQAMLGAGLNVPSSHISSGDFEFHSGYAMAKQLLSLTPRPTALACANDLMALGALRYAAEAGLRVPHDLSVTGFDDIAAAQYCTPALTTVAPPKRELGRLAVEHLQQSARLGAQERIVRKLAVEVLIRGSTAQATT